MRKEFNPQRVITPVTGETYTLSWAQPGCVWKCIEIRTKAGWVKLKTPQSGKEIWAKIESLRTVRKQSLFNPIEWR